MCILCRVGRPERQGQNPKKCKHVTKAVGEEGLKLLRRGRGPQETQERWEQEIKRILHFFLSFVCV